MKYLRVNYRKTGNLLPVGSGSIIVLLRQTIQIDSATGNVFTISMDGYGHPRWVHIFTAGFGSLTCFDFFTSINDAVSLVYVTIQGWTGSMGSLDVTYSQPIYVLALIQSR